MGVCALDELLARSDIVSLHCPLNDDSRGLIGRAAIAGMKRGAYLINVARGTRGGLPGPGRRPEQRLSRRSGIDAFEAEPPLSADHPLLHSKNTIVTPMWPLPQRSPWRPGAGSCLTTSRSGWRALQSTWSSDPAPPLFCRKPDGPRRKQRCRSGVRTGRPCSKKPKAGGRPSGRPLAHYFRS
ncbi:MAG: NAD(P)-dependent oxidoreductase [Intestinimonas sp.]